VTKQRYFSIIEKCLSIFGHRLECTKPESSRLQNIGGWFRIAFTRLRYGMSTNWSGVWLLSAPT